MFPSRYFARTYFAPRYFPAGMGAGTGSFLTSPELVSMRAAMAGSFPSRGFLRRVAKEKDGRGGWEHTTQDLGVYACRLVRRSVADVEQGSRALVRSVWVALLPYGTPVRAKDRLRVDGIDWEVVEGDAGRSEALCLEVPLVRVN